MRRAILPCLCGVLLSCVAVAAFGQATQPATPKEPRVLILPFESLSGDNPDHVALARALQRSVETDLSRGRNFQTKSDDKVAPDAAGSIERGKALDAGFVVRGTVQVVEDRVRVNGEVIDVARGESAGQFKLTSTVHELFELQDAVVERVRRLLANATDEGNGADAREEDDEKRVEVPAFDPIRVDRRRYEPDWLTPADTMHDDVTYRYTYRDFPVFPYGYGYGGLYPYFGYYRYSYSPGRVVYRDRALDYTYRGLPDRRGYYGYDHHYGYGPRPLRSFNGPVPMRWMNRR